ncbi:MAG: ATPase [Prosthecochloris sp.]|uniref:TrkH family potassium uptake protein n=1 Tax=Prosthecochloris sp. TaxID=290513 RepID=UPI0013C987FA|nr:potassium transporter TrkG [Prosthecochloris sp.]NEX11451.1 ATPase [Prosthecochloris sp.]
MGNILVKPGLLNGGEDGSGLLPGKDNNRLLVVIDWIVILLAFPAVFSLVAEYGFYLTSAQTSLIQILDLGILWIFAVCGFIRILLISDKTGYLKSHWSDVLILFLISMLLFFPVNIAAIMQSFIPGLVPKAIAKISIVLTQVLLILALVPPALRYSQRLMSFNVQPAALIIMSFLLFIFLGTLFLLLPKATLNGSISVIDALFMSTSAVCVTGLVVVDTAKDLTMFGQTVIMILMQLGGLGIMTMTTFFAYMVGSGSGLKEYATLQTLLGEESLGRIRSTIFQVALFAFSFEVLGAWILFEQFDRYPFASAPDRLFFAIFHSVSAFCNAGFSLWSENLMAPVVQNDMLILSVIMVLIVLGGLGFPVIANINAIVAHRFRRRFFSMISDGPVVENVYSTDVVQKERLRERRVRLGLHSKLVLLTTGVLLVTGTLGIYLLEVHRTLEGLPVTEQVFASLFHSVSARTAGFNTLDIGHFTMPTLFFIIVLMWIGASPGSTGGGIKTSTLAVAVLNILAIVSGRNRIEIFRKQIAQVTVTKAFSTVILSIFYISCALFILLVTENLPFEQLLFEVVSAVGTVGLSTGITPALSMTGKCVIIVSMFIGRIGMLAVLGAVIRQRSYGRYSYTEENVMIT